jgi:hypothetical protein
MVVPLAAHRSYLTRFLCCGMSLREYTQSSKPVSTRNHRLLILSVTKRRSLVGVHTCADADARCVSFPVGMRCRDTYTFVPVFRIGEGTSKR